MSLSNQAYEIERAVPEDTSVDTLNVIKPLIAEFTVKTSLAKL